MLYGIYIKSGKTLNGSNILCNQWTNVTVHAIYMQALNCPESSKKVLNKFY